MSFSEFMDVQADRSNALGLRHDAYHQSSKNLYVRFFKRGFDIALAVMILPVVAPIIAVLWIIIRHDGGDGFFGHKRVGFNGHSFRCWKIRTMVVDAEKKLKNHLDQNPEAAAEWHRDQKLTNDPRITPFGNFLRKSSLDELPQIWNVLKGEMSFVGPRPVVQAEMVKYGEFETVYLTMRPGITGLWQVSGRNHVSYDQRVRMDVEYVQQVSFWRDLKIIFKTAYTVLRRTGR